MPWLTEDPERLKRFRNGDPAMLGLVYSAYAPVLGRILTSGLTVSVDRHAYRFSGVSSPFELDDVVQETFMRAFGETARMAYDGERPFRHYLVAIAKNLLIDRFRRARRTRALFVELDDSHAQDTDPEWEKTNPEAQASDGELRRAYDDFMASLDAPTRTLVRLRFEENETRRVVTQKTGFSDMQIRARETALRKRFFRLLRTIGLIGLLLSTWGGGRA